MNKPTLKLSPMTRLTMSFGNEMNLDRRGVFGKDTYEGYLEMQRNAEARQEKVLRALFLTDAFLFFLWGGQNWSIPGIGLDVASIPAVQEILLFWSAIGFFIACGTFVTNQCYGNIIDTFGNRIVDSNLIDPDYFNASRKHYDFFLKLFRPKLNIWGDDFFQSRWSFAAFSNTLVLLVSLTLLMLPLAHFVLTGLVSWSVIQSDWNVWGKAFLVGAVALINLTGLLLVIGMNRDFTFEMLVPEEETSEVTSSDAPENPSRG